MNVQHLVSLAVLQVKIPSHRDVLMYVLDRFLIMPFALLGVFHVEMNLIFLS